MTSVADQIELTACRVLLGGSELSTDVADKLVSVRVSRGLSMTGRTVLRFHDPGYAVAASTTFALGAPVSIKAGSAAVFDGVITGTALEHDADAGRQEFVITADDKTFKLGMTKHIRTFEQMKMSDIVTTLAGTAGLSLDMDSPSDPVQDYLLQNGTDLALLDTITKRLNYVWWADGSSLKVKPAGTLGSEDTTLDLLSDLLEFSVRATALRPTSIKVNGWDPKAKQDIKGSPSGSESPGAISPLADRFTGSKRSKVVGTTDFLAGDATPTSQDEAQLAAESLQTMWQGDAVTARGLSFINPKVVPNAVVAITGGGPANGKYLVSEVEHVFSGKGFHTRFTAGQMRQSALVDKLAVPQPESGFVNHGLTTAVVSDVGGSGQNSDKPGKVKVKFNGLTGTVTSAWARVISFGGGDKRGGVFLPEINDEVLVGFEGGDTRRPVVLGALFNGKDAVAAGGDVFENGKVVYRRITSRQNNVIELSDGDGPDKQHVKITAVSDDQQLRIGADRGDIKYPDGKPFKITVGSSSIEFDGSGNITIEGMKITLKADQDIDIQATNNLTAKGTAKIALQGAQAELKGDTQVNVQGGLQASLKAAIVKIN